MVKGRVVLFGTRVGRVWEEGRGGARTTPGMAYFCLLAGEERRLAQGRSEGGREARQLGRGRAQAG